MSNERNVEALYELLQLASIKRDDLAEQFVNRALAQFLAGRGVLVPAALTTAEATEILRLGQMVVPTGFSLGPGPIVGVLERIARGEP